MIKFEFFEAKDATVNLTNLHLRIKIMATKSIEISYQKVFAHILNLCLKLFFVRFWPELVNFEYVNVQA